MSLQSSSFWMNPPWGNGEEKYRLGLKPIEKSLWLDRKIDKNLLNYKKEILSSLTSKEIDDASIDSCCFTNKCISDQS